MGYPPSTHRAHRCSFHPDRQDPYLRLSTVTVFVRDQDRSLRFYLDQLGFCLVSNVRSPSGDQWLTVSPPDGTAMLALVAPNPDSEEYRLIGRSTEVVFLTEDVFAKFEEWCGRGVRFHHPPLTTRECAGVCIQAREVGGDYYDFLELGRDQLGLVIGDVSGKGTAAALLMASLQAHLHNQCAIYLSRPFTPFALEQPERFL